MHGNSEDVNTRQVKVDNWGPFFLQRLQHFFNKSDFCDLTLQFTGDVKVQVHSLVLNACTDYFQTLEKKSGLKDDKILVMPSDLTAELVLPIVKFMYTGKLEFKDNLTKKLYYTAGRLNMPILTKLLDAQCSADAPAEKSVKGNVPNVVTRTATIGTKKVPLKELPETLPGRRLPIWKKRKTPVSFDDPVPENLAISEHHYEQEDEPPKPTRFEWPEDEESLKNYSEEYSQPFDAISYESAPLIRHKASPPKEDEKPKDTFEEVKAKVAPIKRLAATDSESASKKPKMIDIQSVKEYLQEQAVRKQIVSNEEDGDETIEEESMAITETAEDDDDDDDDRGAEPLPNDESYEISADGTEGPSNSSTPHTKSILKQRIPEEGTPGAKKVRFSFNSQPVATTADQGTTIVHATSETVIKADGNSAENHAKIISEVLKKYPHLVQNNKNIKLRIMKQGSYPEDSGNKKVSYVVLKAGEKGTKTPAKVIVKTASSSRQTETLSSIMPAPSPVKSKPISGAENTTGPWLCHTCGSNDDPVNFGTYYEYRRHLQEVHMEKIDARICEHCGHRASKRNLLLYHLYTKHGVQPPRNVTFPKCDQCEYVALSESLLIKHRNNHSNAKDFVCKVCNAGFKSNGALQGHMQANLHSDPMKKKYECPYCHKIFIRLINLKAHVRSAHKEIAEKKFVEDLEDESADADLIKKLEVPDGMTIATAAEAEAMGNVSGTQMLSLVEHHQLGEVDQQTVVQSLPGADGTVQTFIISAVPGQEYIVPEMLAGQAEQFQISASQLADLVQYDGSGAVVNSLGATGSQQTIVITSAPSGGQEQLKLISADGSTITGSLDQLALLTGQNILLANPDGTTTTAGEAGFQAILQPNGVLTLQQVGHVIQADGEAVTEETLMQHGYVTHQGNIQLVTQQADEMDKDGAANLIQLSEMDKNTFVAYQQQHLSDQLAEAQLSAQELPMEQMEAVQQEVMHEEMEAVQQQVTQEQIDAAQVEMDAAQVEMDAAQQEAMQEQLQEIEAASEAHIATEVEEELIAESQQMEHTTEECEQLPQADVHEESIAVEGVPIEMSEQITVEEIVKDETEVESESQMEPVPEAEMIENDGEATYTEVEAAVPVEDSQVTESVAEVELTEKEDLVMPEEQKIPLSEQVEDVVQKGQQLDVTEVDTETCMIIDEGEQVEMEQNEIIE